MISSSVTVGVCGAGSMGSGIAQIAANAGHDVVVYDQSEKALEIGQQRLAKSVSALVSRGKINQEAAEALKDKITWTHSPDQLKPAGLIIEAIIENADVKHGLYQALEEIISPDTVIATNTSSLSVTSLATGLTIPRRFLGLHFFNPAPVMKLVEIVPGDDTDFAIIDDAVQLMMEWGKTAVVARDVPGFIVNRIARPYYAEGWRAFEEKATDAATIDYLYRDLVGFRMGPLELGDLIGHDVNSKAAVSIYDAYFGATRFRPSLAQQQLVAAGRLGRKSDRGVFQYGDQAVAHKPAFCQNSAPAKSLKISSGLIQIRNLLLSNQPELSVEVIDSNSREQLLDQTIEVGDTLVKFSDGATARKCASRYSRPVAVLDYVADFESSNAFAFAASDEAARIDALSLVSALGKKAIELSDRPGLVVLRTLCQLANCAADAIRDQVADEPSIDLAMMHGVNYPFGPVSWSRRFGADQLCGVLNNITAGTGDQIYLPGEILQKWAEGE